MNNKAIFLDRDGIINMERGEYTFRMEDFVFVDGLVQSLLNFQEQGFKLIVISNQSGIKKGVYAFEDVELLHSHLLRFLQKNGVEIKEIYYCPHHPDTGRCICRKPDSLLIEKALARFEIAAAESWFIGDRPRDIEAAEKAGVKGVLVQSNTSLLKLSETIVHSSSN